MSKRIGYVGLSTPLFYDRRNPASRTANDETTSPNPILDGAVGAMLLYDELWFLCKSLCPENMRNLRFVRFLDEEVNPPKLDCEQKEIEDLWSSFDSNTQQKWRNYKVSYEEPRRLLGLSDGEIHTTTDNLRIDGLLTRGTSHNYAKLFMDIRVVAQLPDNVELLTNRISSTLLGTELRASNLSASAESIVLRNVPEYLDKTGPYHCFVEELRESSFLCDFRDWLGLLGRDALAVDGSELQLEVDAKIAESMRKVFLASLDPRKIYREAAETIVGAIGGAFNPIVGAVSSIASLVRSYNAEKQAGLMRWQGFLVEAELRALSRVGGATNTSPERMREG